MNLPYQSRFLSDELVRTVCSLTKLVACVLHGLCSVTTELWVPRGCDTKDRRDWMLEALPRVGETGRKTTTRACLGRLKWTASVLACKGVHSLRHGDGRGCCRSRRTGPHSAHDSAPRGRPANNVCDSLHLLRRGSDFNTGKAGQIVVSLFARWRALWVWGVGVAAVRRK